MAKSPFRGSESKLKSILTARSDQSTNISQSEKRSICKCTWIAEKQTILHTILQIWCFSTFFSRKKPDKCSPALIAALITNTSNRAAQNNSRKRKTYTK